MKPGKSSNLRWAGPVGVLVASVGAILILLATDSRDDRERAGTAEPTSAPSQKSPQLSGEGRGAATQTQAAKPPRSMLDAYQPAAVPGAEPEMKRVHAIDLSALKEKIPNNLYWETAEPTQDPEVLKKRAETKHHWDELKGHITANEASEKEIDEYYDYRRRLSEDYLQFSQMVLEDYGETLPEEELGAHQLNIKLHSGRLAEIPRQKADALARKVQQDKKREEWLRGQEAADKK